MSEGEVLLRKLQVRAGAKLLLIGAPDHITTVLRHGGANLVRPGEAYEAALAFCGSPADVARHAPVVLKGLPEDGLLWFAYRKGAAAKVSGLSRDVGWEPLARAGYRGVRAIAFDEDWSGLRFRELSRVKAGD